MLKKTTGIKALAVFCLMTTFALGQKAAVIKLDNPSFEDYPQAGHPPKGWIDCGFDGETPPDVNPTGQFKVNKKAFHGETYLGMVTRDNKTWEAVGQKLKTPLLKGVTYTFSVYVAQSEIYASQSRLTGRDVNYITPTILQIYGNTEECKRGQILSETNPIISKDWQKVNFTFTPKADYKFFMLQVCYRHGTTVSYNGNILVDNVSDIIPEKHK